VHVLERQQWIDAPLAELFDFFARAENLERITPAWLHFEIRTASPIEMGRDTRIDYRIRLAGMPLRWRTRIEAWEPPSCFVDRQEKGPYRLWMHLHAFEPVGRGVLMTDRVRYALPLGPLGRAAHGLAVRASLAAIFDHRYERIREIFEPRPLSLVSSGPPRPARGAATS
jgi:ligand-binding SRPBCC domain-containing protein